MDAAFAGAVAGLVFRAVGIEAPAAFAGFGDAAFPFLFAGVGDVVVAEVAGGGVLVDGWMDG